MSLANRNSLEPWLSDDITFYQHQVEGVRRMMEMRSVLLADEMGLGKSLQTLAVFCVDIKRGYGDTMLVVCPASLKTNWHEEIQKFTSVHSEVLAGTPKKRKIQIDEFKKLGGPKILIVNYEQVIAHLEQLNSIRFHIATFDEAHSLKNPDAKRTQKCMRVFSTRTMLLTGSPLLNHVNELWTLLERISPGEWGSYYKFVQRYCNTPDAPIWMADGTFKPIGEIQAGDKVMGWERAKGNGEPNDRRTIVESEVLEVRRRMAPEIIQVTMESGQVIRCTPDHLWLSGSHGGVSQHEWVNVQSKKNPDRLNILSRVVFPVEPLSPEKQRLMDWLCGIMDGEGTGTYIAQCVNHNPKVHARIGEALNGLGIEYSVTDKGYRLKGGRQLYANLATWTKGSLQKDDWIRAFIQNPRGYQSHSSRLGQLNRRKERPVKVESLGPGEVVSMQTTSGNYVAWGLASKNCVFGGFEKKKIVGVKNELELKTRLEAVMVRREKDKVLDLPKVQYIQKFVELHPRQRKYYQQIVDEMKIEMADGSSVDIKNSLTKFLRLKQICGTTASVIEDGTDHSYKLDLAAADALQLMDSGERVIAFTQFRSVLDAYHRRIYGNGFNTTDHPIYVLHGDIPATPDGRDGRDPKKRWSRQEIVHAWANNPKPGIIIAMFQVAGVGLNMTAARYGQFLDKLFVPGLNQQAVDRMHRIGASTTQPITILEYLCKNTAEERVEKILKGKKKVFGQIVESNPWSSGLIRAVLEEEEGGMAA